MISRSGGFLVLLAFVVGIRAGGAPEPAASEIPREGESLDAILAATWKERGIQPAGLCTDAEFLRRASLDIIGRIPSIEELRAFLRRPDRDAKVEELLASNEYPKFWAELWTTMLLGYGNPFNTNREAMRMWLERSFRNNLPYDRLVRELITATGYSAADGPVNFLVRYARAPAVKISRTFLGVRLDCARCHDHPFDRWTNKDYQNMNRFFRTMDRRYIANGNMQLRDNPGRARGEKPRFLTGAQPVTKQWRRELAYYLIRSRPFARAFGNRMWYHFLGRGIVNPPDNINQNNRPSIPALLEYLADHARKFRWDIPAMIRLICTSRAYQRSSVREGVHPKKEAVFAYRVLKPLTIEQFFDSLVVSLEVKNPGRSRPGYIRRFAGRELDRDWTNAWEYRETIRHLMTKLTYNLSVPSRSVEELYLRILSRKPSERERKICQGQKPRDIVFALVNSNEFMFQR